MFFQPTFFSVLNENEDTETEEGQLEKTLWIFLEAEPDKILMMTTQEEVGEKMNSSSKTMVQAVTLLTALRMFANGKIMVMIMVMIMVVIMVMIMMIMMILLKEVQALHFFEEKNTLRNNLFSMTRVIIDQQFFSISITLLHNSLSWKP